MKKIMFVAAFVAAMMFAACGNKTVTSDEVVEATVDSVEVVELVDTLTADTVLVAVETVEDTAVE